MIDLNVQYDPDIIPNVKERKYKESFDLFRRACNFHDAAHLLDLTRSTSNVRAQAIYDLAILELRKREKELIEEAIKRYQESTENGLQ